MRFFLVFVFSLLGFSFVDLQAKPIKKDFVQKEFVLHDYSGIKTRLFFADEVAKPIKFDKVLSSKRISTNCRLTSAIYKNYKAQRAAKQPPIIRLL